MTEQELSKYHGYKAYCRALSDEITYLRSVKRRDVSERIIKYSTMLSEVTEKHRSILCYVTELSDTYISKMLYGRYIKLRAWYQIAMDIGGNMSGDTCRITVSRYLKTNEKNNKE